MSLFCHAQIQEWGWQTADSAFVVCQYQHQLYSSLTQIHDIDEMRLEIGSNLSRYYSYSSFHYDSLRYTPEGREIIKKLTEAAFDATKGKEKKEVFRILSKRPGYQTQCEVYKIYGENKTVVQDRIGDDYYRYEEQMEPQEWIICEDTLTILNYLCQKAVCTWRGRNYTAWFTESIPISEGPYKFHGLPGLIVKIADERNIRIWDLKGIEVVQKYPIYWSKPPFDFNTVFQSTTRTEFMKKWYDRQQKMIRSLNNDRMKWKRNPVTIKFVREPIEMDFEGVE